MYCVECEPCFCKSTFCFYSKSVFTRYLKGHTARFAYDYVSALRMERGVDLALFGRFGTSGYNTCVADCYGRTLFIIIALNFGLVIYGKNA